MRIRALDTVAQQANPQEVAGGVAALRSDCQTSGNLFSQSNPQQKADVLNEIAQIWLCRTRERERGAF